MTAAIRVIRPGLYATVQDLGRPGLRHIGVTESGAMDKYALRMANLLVGNAEGATAIEMALVGGELEFRQDTIIAICGAYMAPQSAGYELPMWRPIWLSRGSRISLGRAEMGCRAYIAAAGGIAVPLAMGSGSTDARAGLGGAAAGRPLAAGDVLPLGAAGEAPLPPRWAGAQRQAAHSAGAAGAAGARSRRTLWAAPRWYAPPLAYGGGDVRADGVVLRAVWGAECEQFGAEGLRLQLLQQPYRVAPASDRMGIRLEGAPLQRTASGELLSHGVVPGTVQVPADGLPIILGSDCQTTGGYPKLLHIIAADLPLVGQLKPGDYIFIRIVALEEAQQLELEREAAIQMAAIGMRGRLPAPGGGDGA